MEPEGREWVTIAELAHPAKLPLLKSILAERGIPVFIQGENVLAIHPVAVTALVMVPAGFAEEAARLVHDLTGPAHGS